MKISIVGSGNVAWHFSQMWRNTGHIVHEISSRNQLTGSELAQMSGARFVADPRQMDDNADFIFIAVKDDAIGEVSSLLPESVLAVHSSGATPIEALTQIRRGVIWGVQSFKREKEIDYSTIPFCVEASDREAMKLIVSVLPSKKIFQTNSLQRSKAHMAIVFGNNFVAQLYSIAEDILNENNLPIDILLPSIQDMTDGMNHFKAENLQTGPAFRNDIQTLERHLSFLKDKPELESIYKVISNRILNKYHGTKL